MNIEKKLEAARGRAESYGALYGAKETADDFMKIQYAELYEEAPAGTVAERDAWVRCQPEYRQAVERKKDAYTEFMVAQTYLKLLFAEAEVWRTQQANNRYVDGAHR
jgi:hypothetical protein